jgi:FolB domain-containing protein
VSDSIYVRRLRVPTHIGVTEAERRQPQDVLIDIRISADLGLAGKTDDLSHTLDYGVVVQKVERLVGKSDVALLEHLAEKIAVCLLEMSGVTEVTVSVGKDRPPVDQDVEAIGVTISRPRT